MIRPETKMNTKGYLEGFIQGVILKHKGASALKPNELRPRKAIH